MYKIPVINSLRGLAALLVCLYHFICTTTGYFSDELLLDIFEYGKKGVHIFFIISGIVIPLSMIKSNYSYSLFKKFISKRFIRIEPPYLIAVILGICYLYIRNFIPGSADLDLTPSIRDTLLHLGYLIPFVEDAKWISPVFWTLSIEFQYYLILALSFPLINSKTWLYRSVFYCILIAFPFILHSPSFFLHWGAYFGVGIVYALYFTKKINLKEFFLILCILLIVVFINQSLTDVIIAVFTLTIIHFFKDSNSKIGNFMGQISYSLYLMHGLFGKPFINFMSHRFTIPYQKFLVVSTGLLLSIIAAYLLWLVIEKPSQRFSQKIKLN